MLHAKAAAPPEGLGYPRHPPARCPNGCATHMGSQMTRSATRDREAQCRGHRLLAQRGRNGCERVAARPQAVPGDETVECRLVRSGPPDDRQRSGDDRARAAPLALVLLRLSDAALSTAAPWGRMGELERHARRDVEVKGEDRSGRALLGARCLALTPGYLRLAQPGERGTGPAWAHQRAHAGAGRPTTAGATTGTGRARARARRGHRHRVGRGGGARALAPVPRGPCPRSCSRSRSW
jgi:hypothetical protein